MNAQPPEKIVPKPRGIPLMALLVVALVVALAGLAGLATMLHHLRSDKAKLVHKVQDLEMKQRQIELERQKAAQEGQLALAALRQEEVLAQTRRATNALGRLLLEVSRVTDEAAALKSNEVGRTVALHPDLVAQARRFYDSELRGLPVPEEMTNKLESVRRIEQQVLATKGTAYQPEAEMSVTAQNAALWAEQGRQKLEEIQTMLAILVRESKVKVTAATVTPDSPTLERAMVQFTQAETAQRQRTLARQAEDAEKEKTEILAKAMAEQLLQDARIKASNIIRTAEEAVAEQRRQDLVRESEGKRADAEAKSKAQKTEEEARKIVLRKKASEPKVQSKLGPFITPGYFQIKSPISTEKKPLSYSQLQSIGALMPTQAGLRKLHDVAHTDYDRLRPRWRFPGGWTGWLRDPDAVATVSETQNLLIELGPVLVEMGLLQP